MDEKPSGAVTHYGFEDRNRKPVSIQSFFKTSEPLRLHTCSRTQFVVESDIGQVCLGFARTRHCVQCGLRGAKWSQDQ